MSSSTVRAEPDPLYAIVLVAYRSGQLLRRLLPVLPVSARVFVVDNSADIEDITDIVTRRPHTTYVDSGGNVGFGAACNLAANLASEPFLVFVNPDAAVEGRILDGLARQLNEDPSCSSCGPVLIDGGGRVCSGSGGWLPTPWRALAHASGLFQLFPRSGIGVGPIPETTLEVEWVAGTCLMVRRSLFLQLGGFSARYFLYQEDMDLGRRFRLLGYRQVLRGDLRLLHLAGTSSELQDVRSLAWRRASALVDYLAATQGTVASRLTCAILALGMILRGAYAVCGLRVAALHEIAVHIKTLIFPDRTLRLVATERQARFTREPFTSSADPVAASIDV